MNVTLAPNAYPLFAGPNLISTDTKKYGTFSCTSMSSLLSRIIDGDPFSQWNSSVASDATTEVFVFSFNKRTAVVTKSFDIVLLQNINWKNFLVEYSADNSTYTTVPGLDYQVGVANNTETDVIVNPGLIETAKYIRVTVYSTFASTPNATKVWGGIVVCLAAVQLTFGFLNFKEVPREVVRTVTLGNGAKSLEFIRRSATDFQHWGSTFDCIFTIEAELLALKALKRSSDPFILIMEPGDYPGKAYQCWFDGPLSPAFAHPRRALGYAIPIKVMEVGPL